MAMHNYLRPHELENAEKDREGIQNSLAHKTYDARVDGGALRDAVKAVDRRLLQAPPDLTPAQRDAVKKEIGELEAQMKVGMLSNEEMRRNPPGAVAQNREWERRNKRRTLKWKNLQCSLYKGMTQEDLQARISVARLRPRASRLNMEGSQIPQERAFVSGFGDQIDWNADLASEPQPVQAVATAPTIEELMAAETDEPSEFMTSLDESFATAEE